MTSETFGQVFHETHEQFIQRASRIFPENHVKSWSRIERAVFNHLLGRLISRHGYDSISDQMLEASREDMNKVVRQLSGGQSAALTADR